MPLIGTTGQDGISMTVELPPTGLLLVGLGPGGLRSMTVAALEAAIGCARLNAIRGLERITIDSPNLIAEFDAGTLSGADICALPSADADGGPPADALPTTCA